MLWMVIAISLAVLLMLPWMVGMAMSAYQQITRVELIKAPVSEVWEALDNLPAQTYWRSGLRNVQMVDDDAGTRWIEHSTQGDQVVLRKLKGQSGKELVLEMRSASGIGNRSATLNSVPGGTRVTFVETLETRSPLKRLQVRRAGGLDRRLGQFIQELKHKFAGGNPV